MEARVFSLPRTSLRAAPDANITPGRSLLRNTAGCSITPVANTTAPARIFVIDLSVGREPDGLMVMINPSFVERGGMQLEEEGCLSVPEFNATVVRPSRVVVKGLDRSGAEYQREGEGLLARAFQHEMDHLDGTLFVDRLRGIKRDLIVKRIRKLTRAGKW